jgi:hypothetical protein
MRSAVASRTNSGATAGNHGIRKVRRRIAAPPGRATRAISASARTGLADGPGAIDRWDGRIDASDPIARADGNRAIAPRDDPISASGPIARADGNRAIAPRDDPINASDPIARADGNRAIAPRDDPINASGPTARAGGNRAIAPRDDPINASGPIARVDGNLAASRPGLPIGVAGGGLEMIQAASRKDSRPDGLRDAALPDEATDHAAPAVADGAAEADPDDDRARDPVSAATRSHR